jgi:hypothetical protein
MCRGRGGARIRAWGGRTRRGGSGDVGADLATLVEMVKVHRLAVDIGWRGSWTELHDAADALLQRSLRSKAILDVDAPDR